VTDEPVLYHPPLAGFIPMGKVALAWRTRGRGQRREATVDELQHVTIERGHEQIAAGALGKRANEVPRPAFVRAESAPLLALERDQSAEGADPESAALIQMQVHDSGARQFGRIGRIENCELHPIKAHQAVERAKPEITIRGLDHRRGGVLRQAVLGFPSVDQKRRIGSKRRLGGAGLEDEKETDRSGQPKPSRPRETRGRDHGPDDGDPTRGVMGDEWRGASGEGRVSCGR